MSLFSAPAYGQLVFTIMLRRAIQAGLGMLLLSLQTALYRPTVLDVFTRMYAQSRKVYESSDYRRSTFIQFYVKKNAVGTY